MTVELISFEQLFEDGTLASTTYDENGFYTPSYLNQLSEVALEVNDIDRQGAKPAQILAAVGSWNIDSFMKMCFDKAKVTVESVCCSILTIGVTKGSPKQKPMFNRWICESDEEVTEGLSRIHSSLVNYQDTNLDFKRGSKLIASKQFKNLMKADKANLRLSEIMTSYIFIGLLGPDLKGTEFLFESPKFNKDYDLETEVLIFGKLSKVDQEKYKTNGVFVSIKLSISVKGGKCSTKLKGINNGTLDISKAREVSLSNIKISSGTTPSVRPKQPGF